jgi:hypothetical protein
LGKSLSVSRAYHYIGVDPTTGIYQFDDMNGDGKITAEDKRSFVEQGQKFFGGLQNSLTYKGFQIDLLFQFVCERGKRFTSPNAPGEFFGGAGNQPSFLLGASWKSPGEEATYQMFTRSPEAKNRYTFFRGSDALGQRIVFVRLKNVSVSYELPRKLLKTAGNRIYLQGQYLITVTNYSGLDPETGSSYLPPLTTLLLGLQLIL